METCSEALVRPGDGLFNDLTEFTHREFISSESAINTVRGSNEKTRKGQEFLIVREWLKLPCSVSGLLGSNPQSMMVTRQESIFHKRPRERASHLLNTLIGEIFRAPAGAENVLLLCESICNGAKGSSK